MHQNVICLTLKGSVHETKTEKTCPSHHIAVKLWHYCLSVLSCHINLTRTKNLGAHYAKIIFWEIYSASVALVAVLAMVYLTIIDHLTSTTLLSNSQKAQVISLRRLLSLAARTDWMSMDCLPGLLLCLVGRRPNCSIRGSKSRNKVSVG